MIYCKKNGRPLELPLPVPYRLWHGTIDQQGFETLHKIFNRDVVSSHERDKETTSTNGYRSFWVGFQFCRQPHHPPFVILKYRPEEIKNQHRLFLCIQHKRSKTGYPIIYLMVYPARHHQVQGYITLVSGSAHNTGGWSTTYVSPIVAPLIEMKFSTGGTGHKNPLWFLITKEKENVAKIEYEYMSFRGAIHTHWEKEVTPGAYMIDNGQLITL